MQDTVFTSFGGDWTVPCAHTRILTGGLALAKPVMYVSFITSYALLADVWGLADISLTLLQGQDSGTTD